MKNTADDGFNDLLVPEPLRIPEGLEDRLWQRLNQAGSRPAPVARISTRYAVSLLAIAAIAAMINMAYLLWHTGSKGNTVASDAMISAYQLNDLTNL